jgi:hypothetical protein
MCTTQDAGTCYMPSLSHFPSLYTLTLSGEDWKLWSSSLCNFLHLHITSFLCHRSRYPPQHFAFEHICVLSLFLLWQRPSTEIMLLLIYQYQEPSVAEHTVAQETRYFDYVVKIRCRTALRHGTLFLTKFNLSIKYCNFLTQPYVYTLDRTPPPHTHVYTCIHTQTFTGRKGKRTINCNLPCKIGQFWTRFLA